jgi:ABC-type transport system involved in cytochrome c biogenesis permease subunit
MYAKSFVDVLLVVLPLLYAVLVAAYGTSFFRASAPLERWKFGFLVAVVVTHGVYLSLRMVAFDHPPITSVFEIMTMLAFSVAVGYLYIEMRTGATNTGFFILVVALVFQTVSSSFIKDMTVVPGYLHSVVLGMHVSAALLGYTAISLSAVYGLLYLLLYHEIKSNRFGVIYTRLPNLELLETMSYRAEIFGFIMLTLAIMVGLLWLPRVFETFSYWDPKLVGTTAIWALYAAGLAAKRRFGWQGRRSMILALVGFCFVFLSLTVINLYLSSFHSFK